MKFSHKYIIVGAGSAGCVLANKLSENPRNSVLLIEAGPKDSFSQIKMPLAASLCLKIKNMGGVMKPSLRKILCIEQLIGLEEKP